MKPGPEKAMSWPWKPVSLGTSGQPTSSFLKKQERRVEPGPIPCKNPPGMLEKSPTELWWRKQRETYIMHCLPWKPYPLPHVGLGPEFTFHVCPEKLQKQQIGPHGLRYLAETDAVSRDASSPLGPQRSPANTGHSDAL